MERADMTDIRINDRNFRLSPEQCQKLHNASLEILSRTGVRLYHQEAVDLLKKAGASVSEGNRVRIPSSLVQKALSTVPKRITLYDRHNQPALFLEGTAAITDPAPIASTS
jgi:trimethylamine--corrinoid protein Co-methyltransferase